MTANGPERLRQSLKSMTDGSRWRKRDLRLGEIHIARFVAGASPLHRMWAGTKLVVLAALSVSLLLWPSWKSVGVMAALLLTAFLVARLPSGITPRIPWWLIAAFVAGAALALLSSGPPELRLGAVKLGLGGLGNFTRLSMVGVEVLAGAAVLGWTTPLADLSPALGRLLGPFRRVRVPVDELVAAIALSIRCLPLLLEEARALRAARRARRPTSPRNYTEVSDEAVEVVFGALANAIRRAGEIAEAIEARGGVPTIATETHRLARVDMLVFSLSAVAVAAMAVLH
jgi:energy-coupling factor transporter transmembrane protein EcfT